MRVPTHRVRVRQPAYKRRQLARAGRPQHQVPMIRHQAVVQEPPGEAFLVAAQERQEVAPIIVVDKNGFAIMTAIHHVVTRSFCPLPRTRYSWHGKTQRGESTIGTSVQFRCIDLPNMRLRKLSPFSLHFPLASLFLFCPRFRGFLRVIPRM